MSRAVPWRTFEEAIAALTTERDAIAAQIEALRRAPTDREAQIVIRYILLASMKLVADWANDQGWRLAGASGEERRYQADDVKAIILRPTAWGGEPLHRLVIGIFEGNRRGATRAFD